MCVHLDIKSLYPHLKVNWNVLLCKICIARRLVVDIFPWCNAHYVPFPSGTLVARRMGNGSIVTSDDLWHIIYKIHVFVVWKYRKKSLPTCYVFYLSHRIINKIKFLTVQNMEFSILGFLTWYQSSLTHIFGKKNGVNMMFVSKWFLIPAGYIDS